MESMEKKEGFFDKLLKLNPLGVGLVLVLLVGVLHQYAGDRYEDTVRRFKEAHPEIQKTPPGVEPETEEKVQTEREEVFGEGFINNLLMEYSTPTVLVGLTLVISAVTLGPFFIFLYFYKKRRDARDGMAHR